MRTRRNPVERFWKKVNKDGPTQPHMESPCWVWTAAKSPLGYGRFRVVSGVEIALAHRYAYWLTTGHPYRSTGDLLMHRCNHSACVRPEHLQPGTAAENQHDARVWRGRGHRLTDGDVRAIRIMLRATPKMSNVAIGRMFGVSKTAVRNIAIGMTHAHID